MERIDVIGTAPYAVTLNTGRELSPGEVAKKVIWDDYTENQIATGVLAKVEDNKPEVKVVRTKAQDAITTSTEGE